MSTTFEVYPGSDRVPSFQELLDRTQNELHRFLDLIDIAARPLINVALQKAGVQEPSPLNKQGPLIWPEDTFALFFVPGSSGGTEVDYRPVDELTQLCWEEELDIPRFQLREELIRQCLETGHFWSFRRSVGQPAIINLTYGLLAGCLAELTGGLVFSNDSAWEWERMPALPAEFLSYYFVPELALTEPYRDWSERCIISLRQEFSKQQ